MPFDTIEPVDDPMGVARHSTQRRRGTFDAETYAGVFIELLDLRKHLDATLLRLAGKLDDLANDPADAFNDDHDCDREDDDPGGDDVNDQPHDPEPDEPTMGAPERHPVATFSAQLWTDSRPDASQQHWAMAGADISPPDETEATNEDGGDINDEPQDEDFDREPLLGWQTIGAQEGIDDLDVPVTSPAKAMPRPRLRCSPRILASDALRRSRGQETPATLPGMSNVCSLDGSSFIHQTPD